MTFEPELKKALQLLSDREKDKLILRLLKHDLQLANRLHFELVDTDSVQEKRELVKNRIIKRIQVATERYYSIGDLFMNVRAISGDINEHVFITKDKLGEISLNCVLLRRLLELNNERIASERQEKSYKLCVYIIGRVFKIFILTQKQHEDLNLEFSDDIEAIGELIANNHILMTTAIRNGLDINWLLQFNIPENISEIHKEVRKRGLLR